MIRKTDKCHQFLLLDENVKMNELSEVTTNKALQVTNTDWNLDCPSSNLSRNIIYLLLNFFTSIQNVS